MFSGLLVLLVDHDGDQLASKVEEAFLLVSFGRDLLLDNLERQEQVGEILQEEAHIGLLSSSVPRSSRELGWC